VARSQFSEESELKKWLKLYPLAYKLVYERAMAANLSEND